MLSNEEIEEIFKSDLGEVPAKFAIDLVNITDQAKLANTLKSILDRAEPELKKLHGQYKRALRFEKEQQLQSLLSDIKALKEDK